MNEKPSPTMRRVFEVHVIVKEVVDNPEYYDPFSSHNFRSFSSNYECDPSLMLRDPKIPKSIKKDVGSAASTFTLGLLESHRSMRDGAFQAMFEAKVGACADACIRNRAFGLANALVNWLKRCPS